MATPKRILMVVTSHAKLGPSNTPTGFWLEELAAPYLEFKQQGAEVDIASPNGGRPPADPKSEGNVSPTVRAFLEDRLATAKLENTLRLTDVEADYDAYFVVGGHGVMWDLASDVALQALLARGFEAGKIVAAVCHGPAALVDVRSSDGRYLVAGKRVSAFSNAEEKAVGLEQIVPFALESKLRERGARYESAPMWAPFAVTDGKLVTGQNPASSVAVASAVLAALA